MYVKVSKIMEYAILGGGALGLGAAYRLARKGESVMVFEQEKEAGGLAAGFRVGDAWLEKFYHHLFRTDKTIIKLIEEVGLGEKLVWSAPRTVCLIGGRRTGWTRLPRCCCLSRCGWMSGCAWLLWRLF